MINLRYHVVSLIAVFLALAVGIVMGSTVIDRAIVDGLQNQVERVDRRAANTENENRNLRGQLDVMRNFAGQARDQLVAGQLRNIPVLVVTVQGTDRKPVEALRDALVRAGAIPAGTMMLTNKLRLENDGDIRALASALGLAGGAADSLRRQAMSRLAVSLDGSTFDPNVLPNLTAGGFVGYEPPSSATTTSTLGLTSFPVNGLRVVLVSGAGAELPDDRVAAPFAQALVNHAVNQNVAGVARLVAAESGQDTPGGRAVFVGPLRTDAVLASKLSTVDHLESPMGQAAVVLALDDVAVARTGHYGVGAGAQHLLPPVAP